MQPSSETAASPPQAKNLLDVEHLNTSFRLRGSVVHAVNDVSFSLTRGSTLGIVGESGSGKSALVRSIMNLVPRRSVARSGTAMLDGFELLTATDSQMRRIWATRMAMVYQDPLTALNPVMRIGRQVSETLQVHLGMSASTARQRAVDLLDCVRIPDPERRFSQYPFELSGGMRQRVVIAIALSCNPDVLFADEPTTALDVTIQAQILKLLKLHQRDRDMGMVVISHDLGVIGSVADEVVVMYAGQVVERAPTANVLSNPRMPYTQALMSAMPRVDQIPHARLTTIPGRPPNLAAHLVGCHFAPRCDYAQDECMLSTPPLVRDETGHAYRCFFPIGSMAGHDALAVNVRRGHTATKLPIDDVARISRSSVSA